MAPASGFGVDRSVELEQLNDALRRDVVTFDWYDLPVDFGDRHHRILHSDGVRQFGPGLFGVVILEKVDGDPPAHISRAPVNLGRVFSGERSPADADLGAVVVDDDLSPGKAGVGIKTAEVPF